MQAPEALLQRLATVPGMESGRRRLVLLLPQLGDFDSLEYAQALVPALPHLASAPLELLAIGIGNAAGADRFCRFTGFPRERLLVDGEPTLHRALGLYAGLQVPGGPWPGLLLMCAGIGSPGTLAEVLRGYSGDRTAALRPFELATVRLRNMVEVLGAWRTYLLDRDDSLLYSYRDPGILGFSATMADPLSFLAPYLSPSPEQP
jgi:hypothetical protein